MPLSCPSASFPVTFIFTFRIGSTHIRHCYIPPVLDGLDDSTAYNDILNSIPLLPDTIICGDFNARLGNITGDSTTTTRGRILTAWMEDRHLLLWQTPAIFGVPTFCTFRGGSVHQSVIDLFLSNFPAEIAEMTVRTDLSLSSDHRLVLASLELPDLGNLSKLQEDEASDIYVRTFCEALERDFAAATCKIKAISGIHNTRTLRALTHLDTSRAYSIGHRCAARLSS